MWESGERPTLSAGTSSIMVRGYVPYGNLFKYIASMLALEACLHVVGGRMKISVMN
jgi:hypothetical protein